MITKAHDVQDDLVGAKGDLSSTNETGPWKSMHCTFSLLNMLFSETFKAAITHVGDPAACAKLDSVEGTSNKNRVVSECLLCERVIKYFLNSSNLNRANNRIGKESTVIARPPK